MKGKKPENLERITGVPHTPSTIMNDEKVSLDFVLKTKEGPILCDYYAPVTSIHLIHPINPMTALVNYAHETNQEITVEGRLAKRVIDDSNNATRNCCMNIYQITFPNFGTYTPQELHIVLKKEVNGSQGQK